MPTPHGHSDTAPASLTSTFVASPELQNEIEIDEARIEMYGGDDPHAPAPKLEKDTTPADDNVTVHAGDIDDPNLVQWDGPDDPENPQNWSRSYKWFLTIICSLMTVNVTFSSSAPTATTELLVFHFRVQPEVSYLVTSLFLVGYCVGPILWGPGSEAFGRRTIFCVTMVAYTLFIIGQALAHNIETLLITRFFSGFFACAPLTNCAAVFADIWDPYTRGIAAGIFVTMVFLGPAIGPIVSGFIVQNTLNFRWVFWVMLMFAGVCAFITVAFMPETFAPKILADKAKRLRKEDPVGNKDLYAELERNDWGIAPLIDRTIKRPFHMLAVEPILVLVTIYLSIVYGVLYGLFESIPIIFSKHNFTPSQTGLVFIGLGLGTTLGSGIFVLTTRGYPRLIVEWRGFPPPENRLYGAMIAGVSLVIGSFWLGWSGNSASVPWCVPAIATIPVGISISLIFISFTAYLVDTYLMYSASALASNTIVRSAVGAAFPLFTTQMFKNLGVGWACSLIGFLALVLAPLPFLFFRYGARIRKLSTFAPCVDLKIAEAKDDTKVEKRLIESQV